MPPDTYLSIFSGLTYARKPQKNQYIILSKKINRGGVGSIRIIQAYPMLALGALGDVGH